MRRPVSSAAWGSAGRGRHRRSGPHTSPSCSPPAARTGLRSARGARTVDGLPVDALGVGGCRRSASRGGRGGGRGLRATACQHQGGQAGDERKTSGAKEVTRPVNPVPRLFPPMRARHRSAAGLAPTCTCGRLAASGSATRRISVSGAMSPPPPIRNIITFSAGPRSDQANRYAAASEVLLREVQHDGRQGVGDGHLPWPAARRAGRPVRRRPPRRRRTRWHRPPRPRGRSRASVGPGGSPLGRPAPWRRTRHGRRRPACSR